MEENFVELFHFHFLGGVRSWKDRWEVAHFFQPWQKRLKVMIQDLRIARLTARLA